MDILATAELLRSLQGVEYITYSCDLKVLFVSLRLFGNDCVALTQYLTVSCNRARLLYHPIEKHWRIRVCSRTFISHVSIIDAFIAHFTSS